MRLPIKTAEGKIEQIDTPGTESDSNDQLSSEGDVESVNIESDTYLLDQNASIPIRQQFINAKEELAKIATHINEDPESNIGGLRILSQISSHPHPTVKKLALASQMAVYRDVIPGYRIRSNSAANAESNVSKDVRKLRNFEQSLVSAYQVYLRDLESHARHHTKNDVISAASTASVAITCACSLLLAVPHFNFRGDLLKIIVGKLATKDKDASFVQCIETLESVFQNDEDGAPSLEAVGLLAKMMKARNYQIDERVLNTLLHLRLLSEFSSKASQAGIDDPGLVEGGTNQKANARKEFRTKKQRKNLKEQKKIEKEYKEADAVANNEHREIAQGETLKICFGIYLRILKARNSRLMGAVLEGLQKCGHLINQDFFGGK